MSIDLIAALRKGDGNGCRDANALMARAADEVERLRAERRKSLLDLLSAQGQAEENWISAKDAEAERDRLRERENDLILRWREAQDALARQAPVTVRLQAAVDAVRALHRPERPTGNLVTEMTPSYCGGCYEAGGYDAAILWDECPTLAALDEHLEEG